MIDFFLLILLLLFTIALIAFLIWVITSFDDIMRQFGDRFWESANFWKKILKSLLIASLPLGAAVYWEINYFGELGGLFSMIGFFIWGNASIILLCLLINLISTKIKKLFKK